MSIDIYADKLQNVWLFGRSVLYTPQPIQRESVPEGWYCYDLQGSAGSPDKPHVLVDQASERFAGCILSDVPLKSSRSHGELVPNLFWATAIPLTLAEHCTEEGMLRFAASLSLCYFAFPIAFSPAFRYDVAEHREERT